MVFLLAGWLLVRVLLGGWPECRSDAPIASIAKVECDALN